MPDINKDENVSVVKGSFDVANVIIAIAILLAVLGILKYFGMSPF